MENARKIVVPVIPYYEPLSLFPSEFALHILISECHITFDGMIGSISAVADRILQRFPSRTSY